MMDAGKIFWTIVCFVVGFLFGLLVYTYTHTQQKYKMNLKCVQGELYEEVRTNMYVKSHLECFEQRTF